MPYMEQTVILGLIALISILHTGVCQDEPEITQVILPEIKRAGEVGYLNCSVTRQGLNKVYWIQLRNQLVISTDDKIDVEDAFNPIIDGYAKYEVIKTPYQQLFIYTLIVRRLTLTDAGWYACKVQIAGTSRQVSKEGNMVVMLPPTISMAETTQTLTAEVGSDIELRCKAQGYPDPRIKWVRPNGMALPIKGRPYSFFGETLQITNIQKADRGIYRCIADNDVRPAGMFDSTVYIQFSPIAKPVQTTYGQAQNRQFDVVIECRIAGNPEPDLKWYKVVGRTNGKPDLDPISNDDKHIVYTLRSYGAELSISESWFQLTIINVQANDYGDYYCEGKNKLGAYGAIVNLYETSECQYANCPQEATVGHASFLSASLATALLTSIFSTLLTLWSQRQ